MKHWYTNQKQQTSKIFCWTKVAKYKNIQWMIPFTWSSRAGPKWGNKN